MLSLGGFPPPLCTTTIATTTNINNPIPQSLPFPTKFHQTHLSFLSHGLTHLDFCPDFFVSALRSQRNGGNSFLEMEGFDDFDDQDDDFDDVVDDGDEEEGFVPLKNMKEWVTNKPRGFGEDKVYDTSIEDKLLQEIEQSREAQLANINKLKNNPQIPNSEKPILSKPTAPEVVPNEFRVRLVNLPKKKNIHRDLQLAFKGVPGIVNIIPAVSGNKKTRDPTCMGFAFIDFKSEEDANRFVQIFSRQVVSFGKIQKQIRCEIMYSKSPSYESEQSADGSFSAPQPAVPSLGEGPIADFVIDANSSDSGDLFASVESEGIDGERVSADWEDNSENLGSFSLSESSVSDSLGTITESTLDSKSSKQREKVRANQKKLETKRKGTKGPKLNIPGSANRLKIKEKALLTGVLSKYAARAAAAAATNEEN